MEASAGGHLPVDQGADGYWVVNGKVLVAVRVKKELRCRAPTDRSYCAVALGACRRKRDAVDMRIALAEAFWRSGRTKVVEGKWLQISDSTYDLLRCDYDWIPLSLHPPLQNMYSRHCFWSDLPRVCRVARIRRA